ncbi:LytR/AlgR family response regulator transcription factor [Pedobacter agri]|uniref:LytR/AlgR family response regulator transcription factor n=1 Tax=Pedobacter agri TaxID=454586 RepID=UPI0029313439|nr:response regulator [Pedobacter agri]
MSISCIAIDDDPHSLENLIAYMEKVPELNLVQTFTEPLQALAEISMANPVDIIFMDVEMPTISGIELAGLLRQKAKYLIFTTAYPRYALDAFKVEADAYLLKPYSILHFTKTINNLFPTGNTDQQPLSIFTDHYFYIPLHNENDELVRVNFDDLIAVEDHKQDINFITTNISILSAKINFAKMINMLRSHPGFIQVSADVIISKKHIKSVLGNQVLLASEVSFNIENSHRSLFIDFINSNALKGSS